MFVERVALEAGAVAVADGDDGLEIGRADRGKARNCDDHDGQCHHGDASEASDARHGGSPLCRLEPVTEVQADEVCVRTIRPVEVDFRWITDAMRTACLEVKCELRCVEHPVTAVPADAKGRTL